MNTTPCPKCSGHKNLDRFAHIESGRCFLCGGSGVVSGAKAEKIVADRKAAIERVAAYLEQAKADPEWLGAWFDESSGRTNADVARGFILSPRCPADVRTRALAALADLGVRL